MALFLSSNPDEPGDEDLNKKRDLFSLPQLHLLHPPPLAWNLLCCVMVTSIDGMSRFTHVLFSSTLHFPPPSTLYWETHSRSFSVKICTCRPGRGLYCVTEWLCYLEQLIFHPLKFNLLVCKVRIIKPTFLVWNQLDRAHPVLSTAFGVWHQPFSSAATNSIVNIGFCGCSTLRFLVNTR